MPEINRAEHIIAVFRALSIALQLNLILIGSTLQLVFYCYEWILKRSWTENVIIAWDKNTVSI